MPASVRDETDLVRIAVRIQRYRASRARNISFSLLQEVPDLRDTHSSTRIRHRDRELQGPQGWLMSH